MSVDDPEDLIDEMIDDESDSHHRFKLILKKYGKKKIKKLKIEMGIPVLKPKRITKAKIIENIKPKKNDFGTDFF